MGNFSDLTEVKVGALQPVHTAQFYQADGKTPLSIVGATGVKFRMRLEEGAALKVNNATATIVNAALGQVMYAWVGADVDTAGRYLAEYEVDFPSGGPLVMPPLGYYKILVSPILP